MVLILINRCFPQCSEKKGHRDSGFCGRPIHVNVSINKSKELAFDWTNVIVIQDIHVTNTPTMFVSEQVNKTELLSKLRSDDSPSGQYNFWNGTIEKIYDEEDSMLLSAIFNSRLRSWDYEWSSNRWKGEERHVVEVYVLLEVDSNTYIVIGNATGSEFQITSNKTNTLRNKQTLNYSSNEYICQESSPSSPCRETSTQRKYKTKASKRLPSDSFSTTDVNQNVPPIINSHQNQHFQHENSSACGTHSLSAAATLATLPYSSSFSPNTLSKVNNRVENSLKNIASSSSDTVTSSSVTTSSTIDSAATFPYDSRVQNICLSDLLEPRNGMSTIIKEKDLLHYFSSLDDYNTQQTSLKKPRSASATCSSYFGGGETIRTMNDSSSSANFLRKPRSSSVAVSLKEKGCAPAPLSLEEVGELLVNLKDLPSGRLHSHVSLVNPSAYIHDVKRAIERRERYASVITTTVATDATTTLDASQVNCDLLTNEESMLCCDKIGPYFSPLSFPPLAAAAVVTVGAGAAGVISSGISDDYHIVTEGDTSDTTREEDMDDSSSSSSSHQSDSPNTSSVIYPALRDTINTYIEGIQSTS